MIYHFGEDISIFFLEIPSEEYDKRVPIPTILLPFPPVKKDTKPHHSSYLYSTRAKDDESLGALLEAYPPKVF